MWIIQRPVIKGGKSEYLILLDKKGGTWSMDAEQALQFTTIKQASEYKLKNKIEGHTIPY